MADPLRGDGVARKRVEDGRTGHTVAQYTVAEYEQAVTQRIPWTVGPTVAAQHTQRISSGS
jgi:hypothetical protein